MATKTKKKSTTKNKKSGKKAPKKSKNDIIEIILKDHKPLWKLIKTMKSERATLAQKKAAFAEFAPTLVAHAKPEEKTWYVAMKQDEDLKQEGIEGDIEHSLADQLCNELKEENDDDTFEAKVKVLAELVEHHLEEEEEDMLPDFRKHSDQEERDELGLTYLRLQAEIEG